LAEAIESVSKLEHTTGFALNTRLHDENRLLAIQSTLAIEENSLTLAETAAAISGKPTSSKPAEEKEATNASSAYSSLMSCKPWSVRDLLKAHKLMTNGLIRESGQYRNGDVGVFDGDKLLHLGARPQFIPGLMDELFAWAKESILPDLLLAPIAHLIILNIHPFADGNGRMGRLWHTLILAKHSGIYALLPIEAAFSRKRPEYYQAIEDTRNANDLSPFVEFSLQALLETVRGQLKIQADREKDLNDMQVLALKTLKEKNLSRKGIFAVLGLSDDSRAFKRIIEPLAKRGLIEVADPSKPLSKGQLYRLADEGRAALETEG
jgi:Fic family protein